jgi:hypothetical protein
MPRLPVFTCLLLAFAGLLAAAPDADWAANADILEAKWHTVPDLGAAQGVSLHDGKIYLYGDVWSAKPRVGVIREYTTGLKPTGRVVWLRKGKEPLLVHPTGLTWDKRHGTFLGDTVKGKATIYRLDWNRALKDGNLDNAVLETISDDAAINGCRPQFVQLAGKTYLATADYGNVHPEVRLYDPEKLVKAKRSSAPGVVAHRFLVGPFNQNLSWDAKTGQLTCIQNVVVGRGWQLDVLDLGKAVADGRAWGPDVRLRKLTFMPHDELEGYAPLDGKRGLFITSSRKKNVVIGEARVAKPRPSPKGS